MGALDGLITGLGSVRALITNLMGGNSGGSGNTPTGAIVYLTLAKGWPQPDTVYLVAGDENGGLEYVVRDADGDPVTVDPSATVTFRLHEVGASSAAVDDDAVVAYGPGGVLRYVFSSGTPVPDAGRYEATFQVDGLTLPPTRVPVLVRAAL